MAATKWYKEVLGLKYLYSFGDLAFFDCSGIRLFLSQGENEGHHESIIYFKVEDIGRVTRRYACEVPPLSTHRT